MPNPFLSSVQKRFLSFWNWKLRNYVLIAILFLSWILFFSPNTVSTQIKARKENRELKKLKSFYQEEIRRNEAQIDKFRSDLEFVETYGRENYLMKTDQEDIYLFVEENPDTQKNVRDFFGLKRPKRQKATGEKVENSKRSARQGKVKKVTDTASPERTGNTDN